jgi:hypothetical protein
MRETARQGRRPRERRERRPSWGALTAGVSQRSALGEGERLGTFLARHVRVSFPFYTEGSRTTAAAMPMAHASQPEEARRKLRRVDSGRRQAIMKEARDAPAWYGISCAATLVATSHRRRHVCVACDAQAHVFDGTVLKGQAASRLTRYSRPPYVPVFRACRASAWRKL